MIPKSPKIALLFFIITVSLVYFKMHSQENQETPFELTAFEVYTNIIQDEIKRWDKHAVIIAVQGIDYKYPVRIPQETISNEFITSSKIPTKTLLDYKAPSWIFVLYSKQRKELMWIEAAILKDRANKEAWKIVKIIQPTPFDYSKFAITPKMLERNTSWKILKSSNGVSYFVSNLKLPNITSNTTMIAKEIRVLYSQFLIINVPVHDSYLSSKFKFEPITGVVVLPDKKSYGVVVQIIPCIQYLELSSPKLVLLLYNETHDRILAEYARAVLEGTVLKTESKRTSLTITSPVPSNVHQAETMIKEDYIVSHYWIDIIREGFCEGSEDYKCRDINYEWVRD